MARLVKDPVCGRTVNAERSQFFTEYGGMIYHFCCTHCKETFLKEPERYAKEEHHESFEH